MSESHTLKLAEQMAECLVAHTPHRDEAQYPNGTITNTLGETLSIRHDNVVPRTGLGAFDPLPLEIVLDIILQLDLSSTLNLRHTNRRFMVILDSLLAPNLTRAILAVEFEPWITPEILYKALATVNCKSCGQPGDYMYLLTCTRVCFPCFTEKEEYIPLSFSNAERKFDIPPEIVEDLPSIRSLPGIYTPDHKVRHHRIVLVDSETARQAGIKFHGSEEAMRETVASNLAQGLMLYNQMRRCPRRPRTEDPYDAHAANPLRFMAIVRAPLRDIATKEKK